ncbi:MAG: helix-turn-helix transcriptional regulator [bacterium]|jgi:transcriptional regulator with XRE-family HTH domain|nr:helix-turn-helix transcriptional regulator [bacterium]
METGIFIENLKYIFANLGITKAHVAKMCGVSKATVSMWLAGRKPYRQSIETISELISSLLYLAVTPEQLLLEDLQTLLRKNEVKRVIIKKLLKDLSAMPIDNLIVVNDYVHRVAENQGVASSAA